MIFCSSNCERDVGVAKVKIEIGRMGHHLQKSICLAMEMSQNIAAWLHCEHYYVLVEFCLFASWKLLSRRFPLRLFPLVWTLCLIINLGKQFEVVLIIQ